MLADVFADLMAEPSQQMYSLSCNFCALQSTIRVPNVVSKVCVFERSMQHISHRERLQLSTYSVTSNVMTRACLIRRQCLDCRADLLV